MFSFIQKQQKWFFLVCLASLAVVAGGYIFICTDYAPWGFSDSAVYLSSARNLAAGNGLGVFNADGSFTPLLIFAPFYSILLSLFTFLNIDLIIAIRFLDIIFFALLVYFSGWLFHRISKSFWLALCFALLIASTPVLVTDFTSMMSEPLAIILGVPGFLLLLLSIKLNSTWRLVLSAVLAGLAFFTRYAFFAFPAAGILCLFLLNPKTWRKRLQDTLKYLIISLSPMLVWILIQIISNYSVGSRHYSLDFSILDKLKQFFIQIFEVVKFWLPYRTNMLGIRAAVVAPILAVMLAVVLVMGFALAVKIRRSDPESQPGWLLGIGFSILMIVYGMVLFATYSFSTELISLDDRMLSPMIPIFYGLILTCAWLVDKKLHPKIPVPFLCLLITLLYCVFHYAPMRTHPAEIGIYPNGYTSSVWKENPILTGESPLPFDKPWISNAPDILLFYTNQNAYYLSQNPVSTGSEVSVLDQTGLTQMMTNECAFLILFDPDTTDRYEQRSYPITDQDLESLQSIYFAKYTSENGIILMDSKCIK